ncbi:MAG: mate-domain-containing protein [Monoraphidium minutum]|nr:MAG: mate-domain-containing protein [Monoraphidium minutum]
MAGEAAGSGNGGTPTTRTTAGAARAAAGPPAARAASASEEDASLRHLVEHTQPICARQLSYVYNINYAGGAALPLRLPSVGPTRGGAPGGAALKAPSAAFLEAGTTSPQELARLLQLAGPLLVESSTNIATQLVATTTVARQGGGPLALGALVLAQTQLNVCYSVICGIASAMETCCGQAFGAGEYALLGLVLQCALALCLVIAAPAAAAWAAGAMAPALAWLGQPPAVAAAAGRLLQLTWPVLLLLTVSETTAQYLLAQGVALPASVAGLTQLAAAVPAYWLLVRRLGWLQGVAAAQVSLQLLSAAILATWRAARDRRVAAAAPERATWRGWSLGALRGLPSYTRFAVPAAAMLCLEWWVWETLVFVTGLLPVDAEAQLAGVGFVMQLAIATWTISYSIGTGAATRIANALGAGQALNARRIFRLACCLVLCVNAAAAACLWAGRDSLIALLTPDGAVAAQMRRILPAAIVGVIADGQVAVLSGLLRAAGRQTIGAALYFITYWVVGLPTGLLLGFHLGWGALGLWMGVASATALQAAAVHTWAALRLDWGREVARSQSTVEAMLDSHGGGGGGGGESGGGGEEGGEVEGGGGGGGELTRPLLGAGGR